MSLNPHIENPKKIARTTSSFLIQNFVRGVNGYYSFNEINISSKRFTAPHPSKEMSTLEFQIVVTTPSQPSGGASTSAEVCVALRQCPGLFEGMENPPKLPVTCKFIVFGTTNLQAPFDTQTYHRPHDGQFIMWKSNSIEGYYEGLGQPKNCSFEFIFEDEEFQDQFSSNIILECEVEVDCSDENVFELSCPFVPDQWLNSRLSPKTFPDVHLVSEEMRLPCHKHMLASTSEVFKAMFDNKGHQESKTDEVHIEDIDSATLEKLVEYVYTDNIEKMDGGFAHQLIDAADKYDIVNLKSFAINYAINALTAENVCDFLTLGELIQSQVLMQKALEFTCRHADEVLKCDGCESLSPTCWKKLFEAYVKFKNM